MPHVSGIGTWFAPGAAAAANNASDDIDSTLAPGSNYYNAGATGAAGQGIIQGAANLQNVGADFSGMDADSTALAGLSTNYLNNYMNGGLLTKAAQAQAAADLSQMNSSQLRAGSQQEANAVDQTKQSEDAANASGATTNRAQSIALKLKKAAMQMLISHTNNMTAIEKNKLQSGVANIDERNAQELQEGANSARSNQMSIYESGRMAGYDAALGIGTAVASAGAGAAGTIASQLNSTPSLGSTSQESLTATPSSYSYSGGTGSSAGYATPSSYTIGNLGTGLSKLALASGTSNYSPYSTDNVNSAMPSKDSWGVTSLNNTLPN